MFELKMFYQTGDLNYFMFTLNAENVHKIVDVGNAVCQKTFCVFFFFLSKVPVPLLGDF